MTPKNPEHLTKNGEASPHLTTLIAALAQAQAEGGE